MLSFIGFGQVEVLSFVGFIFCSRKWPRYECLNSPRRSLEWLSSAFTAQVKMNRRCASTSNDHSMDFVDKTSFRILSIFKLFIKTVLACDFNHCKIQINKFSKDKLLHLFWKWEQVKPLSTCKNWLRLRGFRLFCAV